MYILDFISVLPLLVLPVGTDQKSMVLARDEMVVAGIVEPWDSVTLAYAKRKFAKLGLHLKADGELLRFPAREAPRVAGIVKKDSYCQTFIGLPGTGKEPRGWGFDKLAWVDTGAACRPDGRVAAGYEFLPAAVCSYLASADYQEDLKGISYRRRLIPKAMGKPEVGYDVRVVLMNQNGSYDANGELHISVKALYSRRCQVVGGKVVTRWYDEASWPALAAKDSPMLSSWWTSVDDKWLDTGRAHMK